MSDFNFTGDNNAFDEVENDHQWRSALTGPLLQAARDELRGHPEETWPVVLADFGFDIPFDILINALIARGQLEG